MNRAAIFGAGAVFGVLVTAGFDQLANRQPASVPAVEESHIAAAKDAVPAVRDPDPPAATDRPPDPHGPGLPPPAPVIPTEELIAPAPPPLEESLLDRPPVSLPEPEPGLLIPVLGITASQLSDTFGDSRGGGRSHGAIDILAPRGTTVQAVDDGRVVKLFNSVPGGLTVYQFDPSERFAYYYAHLDRYASDLAEGKALKRGDVIGYVGSTGNASSTAPHLHFAIHVLGPEKRWWEGSAINPYPFLTGQRNLGDWGASPEDQAANPAGPAGQ